MRYYNIEFTKLTRYKLKLNSSKVLIVEHHTKFV
jgi:hypothetical protein